MKKGTGVFKNIEETIDVCDWCRKELAEDNHIVWDATDYKYEEEYGYSFEVCSFECLFSYLGDLYYQFPANESLNLFIPKKMVSAFSLFLVNIK